MIDKNDVKMPEQRDESGVDFSDPTTQENVVKLLDMVNTVESKQELRLGNDYYSKFNWFGNANQTNSYFSYQEEAVYDFIFNLNKSGILSDQVGMGKTIEAGMIISELASRKELKSLLIIVPNEIMAQKWYTELETKFGITSYQSDGAKYSLVNTVRNYDDFCVCVYNCMAQSFKAFTEHQFTHQYKNTGSGEHLKDVLAGYIDEDIKTAVKLLNKCLKETLPSSKMEITFDGKEFALKGTGHKRRYVYDAKGEIARALKNRGSNATQPEKFVNSTFFAGKYNNMLQADLHALFVLLGDYFATQPQIIDSVAQMLSKVYPILVIPISYTEQVNGKFQTKEFLNKVLSDTTDSYKHKYFKNGQDTLSQENYRIIDFFIRVGYQTLIVDEVHDYIDVSDKIRRDSKNTLFMSDEYDRFELFDDYYFIKKSSLYKKLKRLADKAVRKIFLTATPIKSDMVDFYLLTLIASNKDADSHNNLLQKIDESNDFVSDDERNTVISDLCLALVENGIASVVKEYHDNRIKYEAVDKNSSANNKKYLYPFFTEYVRNISNNENKLREYLRSQVDYMTAEEIVLELMSAAHIEGMTAPNIKKSIRNLTDYLSEGFEGNLDVKSKEKITRIVFRALLNNTVKMRFEEDFTTQSGSYIKRINELLKLPDGPRRWFKTYRKYGIRHTRHQTYNLSNCEQLEKLSKKKIDRYKNLPIWPKRDGKVIFLFRNDMFFDSFVNVERKPDEQILKPIDVTIDELPNVEMLSGDENEKLAKFVNAKAIFNYINDAMSGGDDVTHKPQSSKYQAIELDDEAMVDYKLALVSKMMAASDSQLGEISKKVLLFAENDRETILEWFKYLNCLISDKDKELDKKVLEKYAAKWQHYQIQDYVNVIAENWIVSDSAEDLGSGDNVLIIIDPKRYEKGVDLQKADTIINFDINYDPLKMEQRIGRIDRIRPNDTSNQINIISFVALNDMSGFVINFFANELKMFTQWMGETTGIVSVDDDSSKDDATVRRGVSFESNVNALDEQYRNIYQICMSKKDLPDSAIEQKAESISKLLGKDKTVVVSDMKYLHKLRKAYDDLFRECISPLRQGNSVNGTSKKVVRFNTTYDVLANCLADTCSKCANNGLCNKKDKTPSNSFDNFVAAIKKFFKTGADFCQEQLSYYNDMKITIRSVDASGTSIMDRLRDRATNIDSAKMEVDKLLKNWSGNKESFTMPYEEFEKIYQPVKNLYWDTVAAEYINAILAKFHAQCDSVLRSAKLFEKFIKTFSIAEFMNNMEERDDT